MSNLSGSSGSTADYPAVFHNSRAHAGTYKNTDKIIAVFCSTKFHLADCSNLNIITDKNRQSKLTLNMLFNIQIITIKVRRTDNYSIFSIYLSRSTYSYRAYLFYTNIALFNEFRDAFNHFFYDFFRTFFFFCFLLYRRNDFTCFFINKSQKNFCSA